MSTACQRLKSPQSLSNTSAHPTIVTLVNIMVMNGWLTSFSFHVNRTSHSWDKALSNSDLKLQGQGHECGQRARSYAQPSVLLIRFLFISYQSDQQFLRYSYFKIDLETSKVKAMREVKGQGCILYPVSNRCTSYQFPIEFLQNLIR